MKTCNRSLRYHPEKSLLNTESVHVCRVCLNNGHHTTILGCCSCCSMYCKSYTNLLTARELSSPNPAFSISCLFTCHVLKSKGLLAEPHEAASFNNNCLCLHLAPHAHPGGNWYFPVLGVYHWVSICGNGMDICEYFSSWLGSGRTWTSFNLQ